MFKSTALSKVLITGSKEKFSQTVSLVHDKNIIHIKDFTEEKGGFRIGEALPEAPEISKHLMSVKSIGSSLDLEEFIPQKREKVTVVEAWLTNDLAKVGSDVNEITKNSLHSIGYAYYSQKRHGSDMSKYGKMMYRWREWRLNETVKVQGGSDPLTVQKSLHDAFKDIGPFLNKLIGLFISGLLISFGAPFWHDFLSAFVGIKKTLRGREERKGSTSSSSL